MVDSDRSLHPYRYQDATRAGDFERRPEQCFDRLAFALQAFQLLSPAVARVVVFRSTSLEVSQGRDLARGPHARWVMLGIPEDASAQSILVALAKIDGVTKRPYAWDVGLGAAQLRASAN